MYGFLADLLVIIHVGYVSYVVLGQLLILLGWFRKWQWTRNFWFRITHLLAITIVVYEEIMAIRCPLTVWEEQLRIKAGQAVTGETFVGRLFHSLIFYDFEPWVFRVIYISCFAVVLGTLFFYAPRKPWSQKV